MIGKRTFLLLAASAVLLLQFADCMSAVAPDEQLMARRRRLSKQHSGPTLNFKRRTQ